MAAIRTALRQARERLGWSRGRLAEASGIGQRTIQDIETGHGDPRVSTILALVRHMPGVTVAEIFDRPTDQPPSPDPAPFADADLLERLALALHHASQALRASEAARQTPPARRKAPPEPDGESSR
jgi:DNA-binding XRE family transcriptional regulator